MCGPRMRMQGRSMVKCIRLKPCIVLGRTLLCACCIIIYAKHIYTRFCTISPTYTSSSYCGLCLQKIIFPNVLAHQTKGRSSDTTASLLAHVGSCGTTDDSDATRSERYSRFGSMTVGGRKAGEVKKTNIIHASCRTQNIHKPLTIPDLYFIVNCWNSIVRSTCNNSHSSYRRMLYEWFNLIYCPLRWLSSFLFLAHFNLPLARITVPGNSANICTVRLLIIFSLHYTYTHMYMHNLISNIYVPCIYVCIFHVRLVHIAGRLSDCVYTTRHNRFRCANEIAVDRNSVLIVSMRSCAPTVFGTWRRRRR